MQDVKLNIFNTIGSTFCVDVDDGQKVYVLIKKALLSEKKVKLSFQNIEILTSAFLNTAIGQLYRDFKTKKIQDSLSVENISLEDKALIKRVTSTAKLYYQDPVRHQNSIKKILGEE